MSPGEKWLCYFKMFYQYRQWLKSSRSLLRIFLKTNMNTIQYLLQCSAVQCRGLDKFAYNIIFRGNTQRQLNMSMIEDINFLQRKVTIVWWFEIQNTFSLSLQTNIRKYGAQDPTILLGCLTFRYASLFALYRISQLSTVRIIITI